MLTSLLQRDIGCQPRSSREVVCPQKCNALRARGTFLSIYIQSRVCFIQTQRGMSCLLCICIRYTILYTYNQYLYCIYNIYISVYSHTFMIYTSTSRKFWWLSCLFLSILLLFGCLVYNLLFYSLSCSLVGFWQSLSLFLNCIYV